MRFHIFIAIGLLAATAVAVTPSASADTCALGYHPDALTNVCTMTTGGPYCVVGGYCPGAKLIVLPRDGSVYVEVSVNYYGLVCAQGSAICVG